MQVQLRYKQDMIAIQIGVKTMYVLADLEWVENNTGLISFTQISMTRVDEKWREMVFLDIPPL